MHSAGEIIQRIWSDPDHQRGLLLVSVWKSWPTIVGSDLSELVKPLGHKGGTLYLGVEDAVVMQEASFQSSHILRQVNAFLGETFFDKVRFDLIGGRTSLDEVADTLPGRFPDPSGLSMKSGIQPDNLGTIRPDFSGSPALARCYKTYVRHFKQLRDNNST